MKSALLETEFREQMPAISPDGRWIAYQSDETGGNEIFVKPFPNVDDGKWQVSTNGGQDPVWSPVGRRLFFWEVDRRIAVAEVETAPTFSQGTPTELFPLRGPILGGGGRRYDLAAEGKRLVKTAGEDAFNGLIYVEN